MEDVPHKSPWISAWTDSVAGLQLLTQLMHFCDLKDDGDHKFIVADHKQQKLKVYMGTSVLYVSDLKSRPVAMTTFAKIRVPIPVMIAEQIEAGADLAVSLSGGKDSTATALYLEEMGVLDAVLAHGGEVRRVFADTGWELPETYAYLPVLEERFGTIDRVALHVPIRGEDPPPGYAYLHPVWKSAAGGDEGYMRGDGAAFDGDGESGRWRPMVDGGASSRGCS